MTGTNSDMATAITTGEDPTPFGWLTTADHKRVGRLYIVSAIVMLLVGVLIDVIVRVDLTSGTDFVVLDGDSFGQLFALSRETLVLLFLIPIFLGFSMYLVPLQIGAGNLAFPRAAAASYWVWLVSAGVLFGAYIGNGGPYGGNSDLVDLHMLAVGGLVVGLLIGAVVIGATAMTMRSPGLYMDTTPPFSWSALVTASMLVVSLPVLLGQLVILYIDHRYGRVFLGGNFGIWERIDCHVWRSTTCNYRASCPYWVSTGSNINAKSQGPRDNDLVVSIAWCGKIFINWRFVWLYRSCS